MKDGPQIPHRSARAGNGHQRGAARDITRVVAVALAASGTWQACRADPSTFRTLALHDGRDHGLVAPLPPASAVAGEPGTAAPQSRIYRIGALVVTRPWSRPTPGGARHSAGYLRIANTGTEPDRLIGGSARIAEELEIHASEVNDGIARMRAMHEGVAIPPGETIELGPGGKHLMFAHLKNSVAQGERFEATLVFEKAGPLVVEFEVRNHAVTDDTEIEKSSP